ncbi:cellulase family glycosylhydrolase [Cohnella sp. WQ 127256]|uniref:cellulase family glycosylhydrolase n=1 Tax=Cohnella sp. WQ 127256 TaxID=2938790 RepID=UPI002117F39E|nr:cellulase family glycosylhydrolase [Cohnella sp. WQ 127256]
MTLSQGHEVTGFLKAVGQKLINGEGREILLRGVGFGSWMLPEGYMWMFPNGGDRPRRIELMVKELVGEEKAEQFWEIYYERYTSEEDIKQIAADGYNSVRVPINSRFLIVEGDAGAVQYHEQHLVLLDKVIGWCREHRLYVILDLHGAPGGQTGTNIDDSENDQPELFIDENNKQMTIDLWRMLAKRYKDEWIVAGYDLLNEPLPNWFSSYNNQIMPLYRDITKAIREVDDRHMIILEGAHWATDWSIFDDPFDNNLMLQFHKYWNNPDTESIQTYLDKREEWNVPIYMGEGGENNKEWYAGAFRLFEDHNISWNFWTWKKMGKDNSPCSVNIPSGWQLLIDYLEGGSKPDEATAERILWEYLHNISFVECIYHPEVTLSLFRRPKARIPAIFYGYKGAGVSYGIKEGKRNPIGFRNQDGVDIRFVEGSRETPSFEHGKGEAWKADEWMYVQLAAEDWVSYDFTVADTAEASLYFIDLCLFAPNGSAGLAVTIDGESIERIELVDSLWGTKRTHNPVKLAAGLHRIELSSIDNSIGIQWLEVIPA